MTIHEAIEHAKEVARTCYDSQCAADHMQLAEWLRQARGADKAARWYTAKIRELENRSKALETLISEKEAENDKLRELVRAFYWCIENYDSPCDSCPLEQSDNLAPECEVRMRELGIEVDDA